LLRATAAAGADAPLTEAQALRWHADRVQAVLAGAPELQVRPLFSGIIGP
jgi:hypothetical protein